MGLPPAWLRAVNGLVPPALANGPGDRAVSQAADLDLGAHLADDGSAVAHAGRVVGAWQTEAVGVVHANAYPGEKADASRQRTLAEQVGLATDVLDALLREAEELAHAQ
jgi:hypothetical protein